MKICSGCKEPKPLVCFNPHRTRKDGLQPYCKDCSARSARQNYLERKEFRVRNNELYRQRNKEKMLEYLSDKFCVDCWESDVRVLEFDHVRGTKILDVSVMLSRGYSWKKIREEIDKCDVVCANCHRKRTYDRKPSYRSVLIAV